MSTDYYAKKKQMSDGGCAGVAEVKSRASSPAPAPRVETRASADRKVAYRADLEESKEQLAALLSSKLGALEKQLNEFKTAIDTFNKQLEGTKTEHLRQVLNDSIKLHNSRADNFEAELSTHLGHINSILSRVDGIEQVL